MTDWKPVRLKHGKLVHVTADLQRTGGTCDHDVSGATYAVDEAPTCKKCLRAMLDELN